MAKIEDVWPPGEIGKDMINPFIKTGAAGEKGDRIKIALQREARSLHSGHETGRGDHRGQRITLRPAAARSVACGPGRSA